ncbi:CheR family methyltransferase [Marinoscillum furvescens]|uniref:Chemotaxis protein methyltransferase CheR n=1 Tax=Marinoscillum furvescens DSM 4134 TaxID=1122208 RepID=A0A3D9L696_MARFU|nr:protein-glutamate O-methyltransferase CheR [Marinoscillum furvescens]REE01004.1 chemotaxis protein methyltransferase CheR [Marinoscillum furvescens DSM 4134]
MRPAQPVSDNKPVEMITDEEMNALMVAIKNRYGLDFTNYEKTSLKRGITRLMMKHGMESSLDLWGRVLQDYEFFNKAIDDLLVNLTELFRNPDVWIRLRDEVLDRFGNAPLNIWHAGCSTGEEVYTMSIVLEEKNLLNSTRLAATDLSTKALEKAKKGEYPLELIKQYLTPFLKFFPDRKLEDYFDFHDKHATIKSRYRRQVMFEKHNLVHDPVHGSYDIVFCRNVMIYFDDQLKTKVLNLMHRALKPGGYLIIGYYDIMPDAGKKLFEVEDIRTRIYRKK